MKPRGPGGVLTKRPFLLARRGPTSRRRVSSPPKFPVARPFLHSNEFSKRAENRGARLTTSGGDPVLLPSLVWLGRFVSFFVLICSIDYDLVARNRPRAVFINYQVATLLSHCAVNAAGWRRLRSTPSPSRSLVAAPGPALCSTRPRSLDGSFMLVGVRGSPVPVSRPRRPSAKAKGQSRTYGAARCCCGVGDGAFCTRSRRAGVVLQPRGASALPPQ